MEHPAEGLRKVFVVGCPRSGTTWLQLLLSKHPRVATAPETQIVAFYLVHFLRQWEHEHNGPTAKHQGRAGLSRVLSEDEFDAMCRDVILRVLERIAARNPGATHVIEKSPGHAVHAPWIQRLLPDARFLHVVRDPRDTVASLLAASRTWGGDWAPHNPVDAARMWRRHVTEARRIEHTAPHAYREIRYERLRTDAVDELESIVCWLGLSWSRAECEAAVDACALDKLSDQKDGRALPVPGEKSPAGFFRRGEVGGWSDDLPRSHVEIVEAVCTDVMAELGYEKATSGMQHLRIRSHDGLQRVREAVDWRLQKLLRRL